MGKERQSRVGIQEATIFRKYYTGPRGIEGSLDIVVVKSAMEAEGCNDFQGPILDGKTQATVT